MVRFYRAQVGYPWRQERSGSGLSWTWDWTAMGGEEGWTIWRNGSFWETQISLVSYPLLWGLCLGKFGHVLKTMYWHKIWQNWHKSNMALCPGLWATADLRLEGAQGKRGGQDSAGKGQLSTPSGRNGPTSSPQSERSARCRRWDRGSEHVPGIAGAIPYLPDSVPHQFPHFLIWPLAPFV